MKREEFPTRNARKTKHKSLTNMDFNCNIMEGKHKIYRKRHTNVKIGGEERGVYSRYNEIVATTTTDGGDWWVGMHVLVCVVCE